MVNLESEDLGKVIMGDCVDLTSDIEDCTLDAVITDPPYFLDGMEDNWNDDMVGRKTTKKQTVSSLKGGMKFDKNQGINFQKYMNKYAELVFPKIKPGGWFISFSAPRLYHRLAVGVEDAGYEIRDMWEWLYTQNQMKAMGLLNMLNKDTNLEEEKKKILLDELPIWKTPQVKSCFEPIVLAQRPREGTFYENWKKYHIGLVNVKTNIGSDKDMSTANVITNDNISEVIDKAFLVNKPTKKEKGTTTHLSVKPLSLMEHIISATVPEGGLVLDPFNGSGTTGIAAVNVNRKFIGFEKNEVYYAQSFERNKQHFNVKENSELNNYTITSKQGLF